MACTAPVNTSFDKFVWFWTYLYAFLKQSKETRNLCQILAVLVCECGVPVTSRDQHDVFTIFAMQNLNFQLLQNGDQQQ